MSSEPGSALLAADESVVLEGVGKQYELRGGKSWAGDLRDDVRRALRRLTRRGADPEGPRRLEALDGVDLRIRVGENVGLVGANGAGKSTLLKLVAHITPPTRGRLAVRGRVAALIQLGAGFHRELTGRENVFLYGAILGLRRTELEARFDEIVAFAELETFMETPLKHFSDGMAVRLGFSVAVHVQPDVLLVDEVLAVGDHAFREKCLARMRVFMEGATTLLFVSHDRELMEQVCDRVILLDGGRVALDGPASQVLDAYEAKSLERGLVEPAPDRFTGRARPAVELRRVELLDKAGRQSTVFSSGNALGVRVRFVAGEAVSAVAIGVRIQRGLTIVFASNSDESASRRSFRAGEEGVAELWLDALNLLGGHYAVSVTADIAVERRTARADGIERALHFRVVSRPELGSGLASLGPRWSFEQAG